MNKIIFIFLLSIICLASCRVSKRFILQESFSENKIPPAPDYSNEKYWAALPDRKDAADTTPGLDYKDLQSTAQADVFFIHPTTYTKEPTNNFRWNADVNDATINKETDERPIRFQASVFNGSCKIYAPRYRQAHISAFYSTDLNSRTQSLALAYSDVKTSFQYYLDHYNHGRPFIIASHSQGTKHAQKLIRQVIEKDSALMKKFICAYIVGMPVPPDSFQVIKPCTQPSDLDCYCSWSTFSVDYYPPWYKYSQYNAAQINPLTWSSDSTYVPSNKNLGAVLQDFKVRPALCDAQIHDGMLWINKPSITGSKLVRIHNYHIGDYNLFYLNIRENVAQRVNAYLQRK